MKLCSPFGAATEKNDGGFALRPHSEQGAKISIGRDQHAVLLGRNLEHNFIVGRRESEIADMHHVVTLFGEPNRQCRREGVVDKKPQEARIRGNSRSRKLSAA